MTPAAAAHRVRDGCALRQKSVRETTAFECMIAAKSRVKALFALAIFANDNTSLVVSDLNDVGFGHVSTFAGSAGILWYPNCWVDVLNSGKVISSHNNRTSTQERSESWPEDS